MSKTLLNIKTDSEVKEEAQKIAREIGVPLSTVVNAYLKEFVREKSVCLSIEPQIRPEVEKMLQQASKDYREKKNISKPLKVPGKVFDYLHS